MFPIRRWGAAAGRRTGHLHVGTCPAGATRSALRHRVAARRGVSAGLGLSDGSARRGAAGSHAAGSGASGSVATNLPGEGGTAGHLDLPAGRGGSSYCVVGSVRGGVDLRHLLCRSAAERRAEHSTSGIRSS